MGDIFFQIFLALLGIVISILSSLTKERGQKWMLLIFGILLILSAGLWSRFTQPTKELTSVTTSWITCDSNVTIDDEHFTWKGPEIGACTVNLGTGEFIVGAADKQFQDSIFSNMRTDRCAAFALRGPLQLTFSINKGGGGDYYSSAIYKESFLQGKYAELDAHPTCNQNLRGYDKIECEDGSCRILP